MISISKAAISEIDEIREINETCLSENYQRGVFEQLIRTTNIARINDKIVGYIIMATLETSDDRFGFKRNGEQMNMVLFSLAVLPEYRGRCIANKLINLSLIALKKYNVVLHVRKSNAVAIHLYNKFNFKQMDVMPDYYSNPDEDGLLMVRMGKTKSV